MDALWDHPAFAGRKGEHLDYRARSQPRINHLLELTLRAQKPRPHRIRVCRFPSALKEHYVHATAPPAGVSKLPLATTSPAKLVPV